MKLPQTGGCLCGDIRYSVGEDPVYVYACHCTDCQTETGSAFYLAAVVQAASLEWSGSAAATWDVELPDGREKGSLYCPRCTTKLGGASRFANIASIDAGTFDDTSWIVPAGHIWTKSAQPWLMLPPDVLQFPEAPGEEGMLAMVRAWKSRER